MSFFRLFKAPNIAHLATKHDIRGLIKALGYYKDEYVQNNAASALGRIKDVRAVEPLVAALQNGKRNLRIAAAIALGEIGDARAVEPLVTALKNKCREVQQAAAEALKRIAGPRAEGTLEEIGDPRIVTLLKEYYEREEECKRAEEQKRRAEEQKRYMAEKISYRLCKDAEVLEKMRDHPSVQSLIAVLVEPARGDNEQLLRRWDLHRKAAQALIEIGESAIEPLIAVLINKDLDIAVRERAAEALGQIGDARAVEPLILVLQETILQDQESVGSWDLSQKTSEALGQIGDTRAVEPLIAAIYTGGTYHDAILALGRIGDIRAVEPLITTLKDQDAFYMQRVDAAEALGQIGDTRAIEPLITALTDSSSINVKQAAAFALVKIFKSVQLNDMQKQVILDQFIPRRLINGEPVNW